MDDELIEEQLLAASDDELTQRLLGRYDVPAYVRRGLRLESALAQLDAQLRRSYEEHLAPVIAILRALARLATCLDELAPCFATADDLATLQGLMERLVSDPPWGSRAAPLRQRHRAAGQLAAAVARFNQRWTRHVQELDLSEVNRIIDGYNRYYLLEKECALKSRRVAARGFKPVAPVTPETLLERFPPLPVPRVR